jgi:molybdopterin-binding protein
LSKVRVNCDGGTRAETINWRPTMKLSAHNIFEGVVKEVKKGTTTAHVVIDVHGLPVWAVITNESVDHLGLKPGVPAKAIIKSTEVIVAVD